MWIQRTRHRFSRLYRFLLHLFQLFQIVGDIVANVEIEVGVPVHIREGSTGTPQFTIDTGYLRHIGKGAIPVVSIEHVRAIIG